MENKTEKTGAKPRTLTLTIPEDARSIIVGNEKKISVRTLNYRKGSVRKYNIKRIIYSYAGYNMLENLVAVRPYILGKYGISIKTLEVLLYLGPKNFFTQEDYFNTPKEYKYNSIKYFILHGYMELAIRGTKQNDKRQRIHHILTLTKKSREIIQDFYECLSGERKMVVEVEKRVNPRSLSPETYEGKQRLSLIEKLNALPIPESKKPLFE